MNAKQFHAALSVSVEAALNSREISLPEIIGALELAKINCERSCYQHAMAAEANQAAAEAAKTTGLILPPNGVRLPRK